jgi:hypothetical protein
MGIAKIKLSNNGFIHKNDLTYVQEFDTADLNNILSTVENLIFVKEAELLKLKDTYDVLSSKMRTLKNLVNNICNRSSFRGKRNLEFLEFLGSGIKWVTGKYREVFPCLCRCKSRFF